MTLLAADKSLEELPLQQPFCVLPSIQGAITPLPCCAFVGFPQGSSTHQPLATKDTRKQFRTQWSKLSLVVYSSIQKHTSLKIQRYLIPNSTDYLIYLGLKSHMHDLLIGANRHPPSSKSITLPVNCTLYKHNRTTPSLASFLSFAV
jgi:hypothetical protein